MTKITKATAEQWKAARMKRCRVPHPVLIAVLAIFAGLILAMLIGTMEAK